MQPLASRVLRDPRLAFALTLLVVVPAVLVGRFSQAVIVLVSFGIASWCWWDVRGAQRLAVMALFASQIMMVVTWLRPQEINYPVYALLLMLAAGVARAMQTRTRVDVAMLALGWLVLSAGYSTVSLQPVPIYALLAVPLGLVGVYLLQLNASGRELRFFLGFLVGFAVLQSCIGVAQTLFGLPGFAAYSGVVYSDARNYLSLLLPVSSQVRMATGTYEHFNGLGALLALASPLAFNAWLDRRSLARLAVLVVVTAGLVATFSRGALLGALTGCMALYLIRGRGSFSHGLRVVMTGLMLLVGGLTTYEAVSAYASATGNLGSRVGAWMLAVGATLGDPARLLFGSGYGYYASGFLTSHGAIARLHSAPVQAFSELGLLGVALLSAALFPPIVRGLRSDSSLQRSLAAAGMAFLIHQMFDNALFSVGGVAFLGVIGGLTALQRRAAAAEADTPDASAEVVAGS